MSITKDLYIGSLLVNNVINDNLKELLLKRVGEYSIRKMKMLNSDNSSMLTKKSYITLQPIGTQYYLFLTKIKTINCSFMIAKKPTNNHKYPQIILLHMGFSNDLFTDTLFDINFIRHNDEYTILVTDLLVKEGKILKTNMVDRYQKMIDILNNEYKPDIIVQQLKLDVTPIYNHVEIEKVITDYIPHLYYKVNGLYLHHQNQTFIYIIPRFISNPHNNRLSSIDNKKNNRNDINKNMIDNNKKSIIDNNKEKSINEGITTDNNEMNENRLFNLEIKVSDIPDIYHLYANQDKYVGIANIPSLKCSKMIKKILIDKTNTIVECKYNKHFSKWEPIKHIINGCTNNIEDVNRYLELVN